MEYGILRSPVSTGNNAELIAKFSTPLTISSKKPALVNESMTLRRHVAQTDVQRWELSGSLAPVADAGELFAHNVVNGFHRVFYVRMPQLYRVKPAIAEGLTLRCTRDFLPNSHQVNISGLGEGSLPIGEFIRFAGHSKVYLVQSVAQAGADQNLITIFPRLRKVVKSGEKVYYGGQCVLNAMYGDDTTIGITYIDGILAQTENFSIVEAL